MFRLWGDASFFLLIPFPRLIAHEARDLSRQFGAVVPGESRQAGVDRRRARRERRLPGAPQDQQAVPRALGRQPRPQDHDAPLDRGRGTDHPREPGRGRKQVGDHRQAVVIAASTASHAPFEKRRRFEVHPAPRLRAAGPRFSHLRAPFAQATGQNRQRGQELLARCRRVDIRAFLVGTPGFGSPVPGGVEEPSTANESSS